MEKNWIDNLKAEYSYCNNIDWIPFPSISPQFFTGYRLICKKTNLDVDKEKCAICIDHQTYNPEIALQFIDNLIDE